MAGSASPSPRPPLRRPRVGGEEEGPPPSRAPRSAWQLSQQAMGKPHSQHAPGQGQEVPSQHATGHPHYQHALEYGQGAPFQHALGYDQEVPSQHALGQAHSHHAPEHDQGAPSQHAPGYSQEAPSQYAPLEPHSQHALGELLPQPSATARRVLFADALGLPLTRLRRYQPWPPPSPESPPEVLPPTGQSPPSPYLLPAFVLPPSGQGESERLARLRQAMVELEEVQAPGPGQPWLLQGTVRVLNVTYHKAVHVRASRDHWRTYRDHPACYVPGGSPDGGLSDRFAFSLPFGPTEEEEDEEEGDEARLDFVIRYQTNEGVYWANNQGKNYSVVLKGVAPPWGSPRTASRDGEGQHLRSCMRLGKMRPCTEEPNDEEGTNPSCEEEGSPKRESLRDSPSAPTPQPVSQVAQLTGDACCPEKEPPARESPMPVPESPWGSYGSVVGELGPEGLFSGAELWQPEEEAVDQELEQLYVSHLSRLQAEELRRAGGQTWGAEEAGPLAVELSTVCQDVLTTRDLVTRWAGPERALNSSLVQEITLRYASLSGPSQEDEGTTAGMGRDSPPALLEVGVLSRLAASAAAVVVPARAAVGPGHGAWGGPRGFWLGSEPGERSLGSSTRLRRALTYSSLIFGLVVILPVVFSGCLPAAALALYVFLTWCRDT